MRKLAINKIKVRNRFRKSLGDIHSLATSIEEVRITESLFYIKTHDDALIRQRVEQLIEILNDAFGLNNYSRQISADFNRAFRKYPRLFIASAVFCGRYEQHDSALSKTA
jgi:hypothetical protein